MRKTILNIITTWIIVVWICVICIGFIKSVINFFKLEVKIIKRTKNSEFIGVVRHQLWVYLLLGLEFFVAADVLETITNPNIENLMELGIIVIIRIAISFFLWRELKELKNEELISKNK